MQKFHAKQLVVLSIAALWNWSQNLSLMHQTARPRHVIPLVFNPKINDHNKKLLGKDCVERLMNLKYFGTIQRNVISARGWKQLK